MLRAKLASLGLTRSFIKNRKGATAVEFALVAAPFLGLMGTITETGLVFLSNQALEQAVSIAGRAVMVGQVARTAGDATAKETYFKTSLCDNVKWFLNCADVLYDVRAYNKFSDADLTSPVTGANFDATGLPRFLPGTAGQIVVVRGYYKRKIWADYLGSNLGYLTGGYHLIVATSVFKSEP